MERFRFISIGVFCLFALLSAGGQETSAFADPGAEFADAREPVISDSTDFIKASLMVGEPSQTHIQSVFGHAFLRMQCPSMGLDFCFSMESGNYEGFRDICVGNYPNRLAVVPTEDYLKVFLDEGRWVREYPLDLTLHEGQRLWQLLDETSMAGDSPYHDYFHHGCSQEIMRFLTQCLDGQLVYGERAKAYGNTIFTLGNQQLPVGSWVRMVPSMLSTTDGTDRNLSDAEKTMIPSIIPDLLSDAVVVEADGTRRSILRDVSPVQYFPPVPQVVGSPIPAYVWYFCGLLAVLAFSLLALRWPLYGCLADGVLFVVYLAIVFVLLYVCAVSTLPTTSGWNWNYLIYNPLPLLLWLCGRFHTLSWMRIYRFYALWIILFLLVMTIVGDHLILEQYLLAASLALRCLFKAFSSYRSTSEVG